MRDSRSKTTFGCGDLRVGRRDAVALRRLKNSIVKCMALIVSHPADHGA